MKNFAIAVLLALAVLAGFVATRPSEFTVQRTRTLAAPPEVVHAYVNDFHKWAEWSPWEKLDPNLMREYEGAPAGPGASYHWVGNEDVGEGRMTITDSTPPQGVTIRLEFVKPFQATNTVDFLIVAGGLGTDVTWAMSGRNDFMAKAVGLVMNMDKMVGAQFEKGLADLDTVTAAATPPPPPPEPPPAEETAPEGAAPEAAAPEAATEPPAAAPPAAE